MKIKITNFKRPFAFWGTVYLNEATKECPWKLAHEAVHIKQQGNNLLYCIWWVFKFRFIKSFCRKMETEARIAEAMAGGIASYAYLRKTLTENYWGAYTPEQAEQVVETIKEKRGENQKG